MFFYLLLREGIFLLLANERFSFESATESTSLNADHQGAAGQQQQQPWQSVLADGKFKQVVVYKMEMQVFTIEGGTDCMSL